MLGICLPTSFRRDVSTSDSLGTLVTRSLAVSSSSSWASPRPPGARSCSPRSDTFLSTAPVWRARLASGSPLRLQRLGFVPLALFSPLTECWPVFLPGADFCPCSDDTSASVGPASGLSLGPYFSETKLPVPPPSTWFFLWFRVSLRPVGEAHSSGVLLETLCCSWRVTDDPLVLPINLCSFLSSPSPSNAPARALMTPGIIPGSPRLVPPSFATHSCCQ